MKKEKISHWLILSGKIEAITKTRKQVRRKMAEVKKRPKRHDDFLYIGKCIFSKDKKHFKIILEG